MDLSCISLRICLTFPRGFVQYFTADLDVAIVHKASALSEELWARVDGVVFCYATDNVCLVCRTFVKPSVLVIWLPFFMRVLRDVPCVSVERRYLCECGETFLV